LLLVALGITGAIAAWGLIDAAGLAEQAAYLVHIQFVSRCWNGGWLAFLGYG
jgi:hypothetical protein